MTITPHETALEAAAKALASRLDISLGWKDGTAWSMPDVNGNSSVAGFIKDAEEAISAYLSSIGGVVCQREPVGYATELELKQLKLGATVVDLFRNGVADSSVISLHAPLPIAGKGDDGWLPIETAPREGGFLAANSSEVWAAWHYDSENWHAKYGSRGATHWRPLPAPPSILSEDTEGGV